MKQGTWPKVLPPLTEEQMQISDDFMKYWHEVLASHKQYSVVDRFNHEFVVKHSQENFQKTLEIGAGLGEHLVYEKLSPEQEAQYLALEYRDNMAQTIQQRFPKIQTRVGDCQKKLDFPDDHFDRIIAIHLLEHLPNLPACIQEMYRLCDKEKGNFLVVIPCEGGLAYSLARKISAQRIFEKRYQQSYRWFYTREHINLPQEIIEELQPYFRIEAQQFFPLRLPSVNLNLCIGLQLKPIKQ